MKLFISFLFFIYFPKVKKGKKKLWTIVTFEVSFFKVIEISNHMKFI